MKNGVSVDRTQGNFDITVDHRLLSVTGQNDIAEDATKTGEMIWDVAFQLGATDLSKALYNIKDPTIVKALKGNAESALDVMIEAGVDPAIAKQLLTTPELYKAASDVLYAYDQSKRVTDILGQPLELVITGAGSFISDADVNGWSGQNSCGFCKGLGCRTRR